MKISIITVAFNAVDTIEDTVLSVASQQHADIEHVMIDGGSTDGTRDVLERHRSRFAKLVMEPDHGMWDAMNKGIRLATGDVVGILNADDVYADPTVMDQVASAMSDGNVEGCYSDLVYVDRPTATRVIRHWKSREYAAGLFETGWCPPHPTVFVRRPVYERCGTFDPAFHFSADAELLMRILAVHGVRTAYVPKVWVKMRIGGLSNKYVRNIPRQQLEILRAGRKNGLRMRPALFLTRKLRSRIRQFLSKPER